MKTYPLNLVAADARPVPPPDMAYTRARSWSQFTKLFQPLPSPGGNTVWQPELVPAAIPDAHIWSVYHHMDGSGLWRLQAGRSNSTNRIGLAVTVIPWGGLAKTIPNTFTNPMKDRALKSLRSRPPKQLPDIISKSFTKDTEHVTGTGSINIKRQPDGIAIDLYPLRNLDDEPVASTCAHLHDLIDH